MKKPFLSLRYKLLLSILFILLASYSVLLSTTVNTVDRFLNSEINRDLEAGVGFARNQYYSRAEEIRLVFMQPASAPSIQERFRKKDRSWLHAELTRWKTLLPFIDVIKIVDGSSRLLADSGTGRPGAPLPLPHIIDRAFADRRPIIATELVPSGFACRKDESSSCTPLQEPEVMMMTIVVPVIAADGEVLGGIVAGDVINGDPYYPTQMQKVFGQDVELTITMRDRKISGSQTDTLPEKLPPAIMSVLERNKRYRGDITMGNMVYRSAFEPVSNSQGRMVGSISVAIPRENLLKIKRDTEKNILLSAFVGIILTLGMAFAVTRNVTRPLRALSQSVKKVEEGDLGQRVAFQTGDEVGLLAESFNRMAAALADRDGIIRRKNNDLQEMNDLLERTVNERTAEFRMEMERLEKVLTSMVEGIIVSDRENRIIIFNPAAGRLLNLIPAKVVNQPLAALCEITGLPLLAAGVELMRSGGGNSSGMEKEMTMGGKLLKVNLSPLLDEARAFAGVVMSIRDVTLEEEVDRMKTEFISTVSHELKTPLTCMKGSLQYILGKGKWLTTNERELLSVCLRNTERLIRLIGDILDISRIEEGHLELSLKPQSIRNLAAYAIEEISPLAMDRTITIINDIPDNLPLVYGDHDRLLQVLTNLLSNAVKFSPPARVVTVSAFSVEGEMHVSVSDSGEQIPKPERGKLFSKFYRMESGAGSEGERGGTGLGLTICREIISKHNGRIFYSPGTTGGNVFTFTIPLFRELHES